MVSFLEIQEYVFNKRVAVVGNASGILRKQYGNIIESYDIVLRMNRAEHKKFDHKHLGKRTDIYVAAMKDTDVCLRFVNYHSPKYVIRFPRSEHQPNRNEEFFRHKKLCFYYPNKLYQEIRDVFRHGGTTTHPTIGSIVLYFLSYHFNPKEIGVFGFDFLQDSCKTNIVGAKYHYRHDPDKENLFCKELIKRNKKIKFYNHL